MNRAAVVLVRAAAALVLALVAMSGVARAEAPPLIPREVLFGNPEKVSPQLSPDGKVLAYLAPDQRNVMQVWVRTLGKTDDRAVTQEKKRGIPRFSWAYDGTLLYPQDQDGDENFHLLGVDLKASTVRDLTPFQGVRAELVALDPKQPDVALVRMNARSRELFDVYRLNLRNGALDLDTQNPGDVSEWVADHSLVVRVAQVATPEGGTELRVRPNARGAWKSWLTVTPQENLDVIGFSPDGKGLYLASSLGADTTRLVERNLATGAEQVLAADERADLGARFIHPAKHHVQAASFNPARVEWKVLDPSVKADFQEIAKLSTGDLSIPSRDVADERWIVAFTRDDGPVRYYAWDRKERKATFLFVHQPRLEGLALAKMEPVTIEARDGLQLRGYLSLPPGVPAKGLPLVLWVHGGPWARDSWGFNPTAQWLANRGYAVLQVNYRGSQGFGKKFLHAGDREWGKKMQHDLTDAVGWAVKQGYADPRRVAIGGGSYGGYAALAGAAFTPDVYRCAVDIVGPSSIATLLNSVPPYWKPQRTIFAQRVGNVEDPKDAELIRSASPLFSADQIKIPLLIGQGANDPRVKQQESEQIVAALEKNGARATYVLYPDEGHGFVRPENRIDFYARVERFLGAELGGRVEPIQHGERVPGSTAVVRTVGPAKKPAPTTATMAPPK